MVRYGPILKRFLLKCQAKIEFIQNRRQKNSTRQKKKSIVRTKNDYLKLCLQEKSNHETSGLFEKLTRAAFNRLFESGTLIGDKIYLILNEG
jgi:hypothetical protein